jgi:hypothetical protein
LNQYFITFCGKGVEGGGYQRLPPFRVNRCDIDAALLVCIPYFSVVDAGASQIAAVNSAGFDFDAGVVHAKFSRNLNSN